MRGKVVRTWGLLLLLSGIFSHSQILPVMPEITVRMRVVDEEGAAVSGAVARVGFGQGGNAWIGESKSEVIEGRTDKDGWYRAGARCTGSLGVAAEKEGYYKSSRRFFFHRSGVGEEGPWHPFDPAQGVTVVLRRVRNPTPLYVKRVDVKIPRAGEAYGFDLVAGDWVAPYGRGMVTDFVFQVMREITSRDKYDACLTVSGAGTGDGFLRIEQSEVFSESDLRLYHEAPLCCYERNVNVRWGRNPLIYGEMGDDYQPNYFFRVRTEIGEDSRVVRALYGKIHGALSVLGILRNEMRLNFTYYLNPTPNDRNLEFDPKRNLFTNLKPDEKVYDP